MGYKETKPGTIVCMRSWYLWHSLGSFLANIQKLDSINFSSEDSVVAAEKVINTIVSPTDLTYHSALFEVDRRFPYPGAYVYVFAPEYTDSLLQLQQTIIDIRKMQKDGLPVSKFTDLIGEYLALLSDIKLNIVQGYNVYDQSKFEEVFQVSWH